MDNPELCPTCRQPLPWDAKTKPGGNNSLPLCEPCLLAEIYKDANFIVEEKTARVALCYAHWKEMGYAK